MQSSEQSRYYRVGNRQQAAAFENPLRCRLLMACCSGQKSLSQLRDELDTPLPKLHYHAERLIAVRLLMVPRSEARAGRPIRYFSAVAERFLVPQEFLAQLPAEAWAAELRQAIHDENVRAGELSLLYAAGASGKMTVQLMRTEETRPPRHFEVWRRMRLDPQQRAALAEELAALLERYSKIEPSESARDYLAHAAFAPRRQG